MYRFLVKDGTHIDRLSGKSFRKDEIIKTNQKLDEIFPDRFRLIEEIEEEVSEVVVTVNEDAKTDVDSEKEEKDADEKPSRRRGVEPTFKKVHLGGGYYNVENTSTGEKMNDKKIKKAEADELVESLNGE